MASDDRARADLPRSEQLANAIDLLCDTRNERATPVDRVAIVQFLSQALESQGNREQVLRLPNNRAERLLSLIQDVLDDPDSYHPSFSTDETSMRAIFRLFLRLAQRSQALPSSLFLYGIAVRSIEPVSLGGFSDVFQGMWKGQVVALKRLRLSISDSENVHRTFYREALIWRQLHHRYILPFLGIDRETFSRLFCMVSPWMRQGTIREYAKDDIGVSERLRLLQEAAEGITYLHSRCIVHGDIRGFNIFVNDTLHVQLADFGLSAIEDKTSVATATRESGAKRWMAPELLAPDRFGTTFERTLLSDTFAFGGLCLEIFTGKHPFFEIPNEVSAMFQIIAGSIPHRPSSAESFGHGVPDDLWNMMCHCWAHHCAERPSMQHAERLIAAIRSAPLATPTSATANSSQAIAHRRRLSTTSEHTAWPLSAMAERTDRPEITPSASINDVSGSQRHLVHEMESLVLERPVSETSEVPRSSSLAGGTFGGGVIPPLAIGNSRWVSTTSFQLAELPTPSASRTFRHASLDLPPQSVLSSFENFTIQHPSPSRAYLPRSIHMSLAPPGAVNAEQVFPTSRPRTLWTSPLLRNPFTAYVPHLTIPERSSGSPPELESVTRHGITSSAERDFPEDVLSTLEAAGWLLAGDAESTPYSPTLIHMLVGQGSR